MDKQKKTRIVVTKEEPLAFTWSPRPVNIIGTRNTDYSFQYDCFITLLMRMSECADITFTAELNLNGSIHYHGILSILDKYRFYRRCLPSLKREGFVLIKKIDNLEKWLEYINKDVPLMNKLLKKEFPITYKYKEFKPRDTTKQLKADMDVLDFIGKQIYEEELSEE